MSATHSPAIDLDELLGRCLGNLEIAESAVVAFLDEFPTNYQQLDAASRELDPESVALVAHRMKGAARNIGAGPMADMLESIEKHAKDGRCDELRPHVDEVAQEIGRLEEALG